MYRQLDRGRPVDAQRRLQSVFSSYLRGVALAVSDLKTAKKCLEDMVEATDFVPCVISLSILPKYRPSWCPRC
jgi:hypothetical protein